MNFCSLNYFLFLPAVTFLYWRFPANARRWWLVIASYFFYMSWIPAYGLLLFSLSLVNWLLASLLSSCRYRRARVLLFTGIAFNLAVLVYYKYANFFWNIAAHLIIAAEHCLGFSWNASDYPGDIVSCVLPLGISFFAFEFIHYLVDVYQGAKPIDSLRDFLAFTAFFPSQIAGPIKRFQDFELKCDTPEDWSLQLFYEGGALIVQGTFKKVAIADSMGMLVSPLFNTAGLLPSADAWFAVIGFAVQLYCDFSGYTDIARGSALLMGIRLPLNFDLPYLACDIQNFWRRWHISLSEWLRDYLFIPLGGSRGGRYHSWRNVFLTMSVCGLWHGAQWHFILFGMYHGLAMIVNREWIALTSKSSIFCKISASRLATIFDYALCAATWLVGWIIFRAPDVQHVATISISLFYFGQPSSIATLIGRSGVVFTVSIYLIYWLLVELARRQRVPAMLAKTVSDGNLYFKSEVRLASWTAALLLILAVHPREATPFIYFQF